MSLSEIVLEGHLAECWTRGGAHSPAKDHQPLSPASAGLTQGSSVSPLDTEAILEWETRAWIF